MARKNNIVPNPHFHKDWQRYVKTWFNQPARKTRRQQKRAEKAAKIFPRPAAGYIRPVVHCQTVRYAGKVRLGRGFTLEEIKTAGINRYEARTIGISIDHRRRNKSEQSLRANVQRLKEYRAKLILFPKHAKTPKPGDSTEEEQKKGEQQKGDVMAIKPRVQRLQTVHVSQLDPKFSAFAALRKARADAYFVGIREKRKKFKAEKALLEAKKSEK